MIYILLAFNDVWQDTVNVTWFGIKSFCKVLIIIDLCTILYSFVILYLHKYLDLFFLWFMSGTTCLNSFSLFVFKVVMIFFDKSPCQEQKHSALHSFLLNFLYRTKNHTISWVRRDPAKIITFSEMFHIFNISELSWTMSIIHIQNGIYIFLVFCSSPPPFFF